MRVNIYETIEVSDQDRVALARHLDGEEARSRQATRDEIKSFVWAHGSGWRTALLGPSAAITAPAEVGDDFYDSEDEDEDEDENQESFDLEDLI